MLAMSGQLCLHVYQRRITRYHHPIGPWYDAPPHPTSHHGHDDWRASSRRVTQGNWRIAPCSLAASGFNSPGFAWVSTIPIAFSRVTPPLTTSIEALENRVSHGSSGAGFVLAGETGTCESTTASVQIRARPTCEAGSSLNALPRTREPCMPGDLSQIPRDCLEGDLLDRATGECAPTDAGNPPRV